MATAGYPYIAQAIRRILGTKELPNGSYPSIDPDTYEGWYEMIHWRDETIPKPSKQAIAEKVAEIKAERTASGEIEFDVTFDVIV